MALAIKRLLAGDASIGDVKYSYLSEAQFVAENGSGWVLDDGRSIVGSKLHAKYGFTTTKDARGMFFRAANNGRTGTYADPGGDRSVGQIQGHAFQTHTHGQNPHEHKLFNTNTNGGPIISSDPEAYVASSTGVGGTLVYYDEATITSGGATVATAGRSSPVAATNQSQSATGAAAEPTSQETRPVNMAFNVFVKIN